MKTARHAWVLAASSLLILSAAPPAAADIPMPPRAAEKMIVVPILVKLTEAQAREALRKAGHTGPMTVASTAKTRVKADDGTVYMQDKIAGSEIEAGRAVTVILQVYDPKLPPAGQRPTLIKRPNAPARKATPGTGAAPK